MTELLNEKMIKLFDVNDRLRDGNIDFNEAFRQLINIEMYYHHEIEKLALLEVSTHRK